MNISRRRASERIKSKRKRNTSLLQLLSFDSVLFGFARALWDFMKLALKGEIKYRFYHYRLVDDNFTSIKRSRFPLSTGEVVPGSKKKYRKTLRGLSLGCGFGQDINGGVFWIYIANNQNPYHQNTRWVHNS